MHFAFMTRPLGRTTTAARGFPFAALPALLLGAFLVLSTGLGLGLGTSLGTSAEERVHDVAHDTRHAYGLPCH